MLAHLYHAHHSLDTGDLAFWSDMAANAGGPVLELGCGTGRLTVPLCHGGRIVFGVDRDPDMLAILRRQAGDLWGAGLYGFQGDMTAFRLARHFPLILLPCNTLTTLVKEARASLFERVRAHLSPGGRFAASLPNPVLLADLPPSGEAQLEAEVRHPVSGNPVQVSSAWTREGETIVFSWHYDHLHPDGHVDRRTLSACHYPASAEKLQIELESAALQLEATYGDYHQSPYSPDSPYLILVAGLVEGR